MAEWVLVFTRPDLELTEVSKALSHERQDHILLSQEGTVLTVWRGNEHVELVHGDDVATLAEYDEDELAVVQQSIPRPAVFRVSYYRGTTLLADVLRVLYRLDVRSFVDNDYGVIAALGQALEEGVDALLDARGDEPTENER